MRQSRPLRAHSHFSENVRRSDHAKLKPGSAGAHALIILDKAAWHTTRKLKLPRQPHAGSVATCLPGTECGGKHLAILAPDLSLQPLVRKLHRNPRRLPVRMA